MDGSAFELLHVSMLHQALRKRGTDLVTSSTEAGRTRRLGS